MQSITDSNRNAQQKNLIDWHGIIVAKPLMFILPLVGCCLELEPNLAYADDETATNPAYDAVSKEYLGRAPMILANRGIKNHLRYFDSLNACRSINV